MRIPAFRILVSASALTLAGCAGDGGSSLFGGFDLDLRGSAGQLDTSEAARSANVQRPVPDARGVVTYPGYQVAMARRGDTVRTVAARVGIPAEELARHNTLPDTVILREGEILALPRRVPTDAGTLGGNADVVTIASSAIDAAEGRPGVATGAEPSRHRVRPGETAFSIARLYDIPVAELAEWNGLGPDLALRVGQYLLIPVRATPKAENDAVRVASIEAPGVELFQKGWRRVAALSPQLRIDPAPDFHRLRMPGPPEILRQAAKLTQKALRFPGEILSFLFHVFPPLLPVPGP